MIAHNGQVWLRCDVRGDGEPLLMIMGLSGSARAWWRLLPHLDDRAQLITFDNRGTGDSDRVRSLLSMDDLVADALAVLDAAGHESAHVFGVSMGGMIAQHLALEHRERVRSLILGCTTPGGRRGAPPWRLLAATALRPVVGVARTFGIVSPALYAERTRHDFPERIAEDQRVRLQEIGELRTTIGQMSAITGHDTRTRLHELAGMPTTVIHGLQDALVPFSYGRELAEGIPGARLVAIEHCGHMLTTDAEEEAAAAVIGHLDEHAPRGACAIRAASAA